MAAPLPRRRAPAGGPGGAAADAFCPAALPAAGSVVGGRRGHCDLDLAGMAGKCWEPLVKIEKMMGFHAGFMVVSWDLP